MLTNRKARFNYNILGTMEAGISLFGSEVKSIRNGMGDIVGSHVMIDGFNVWIVNMLIPKYQYSETKLDTRRNRRLLLKKKQIRSLIGKTKERGVTIIPLKVYFVRGFAKVEIGIAQGKNKFDKRQTIKERDKRRYGD
ncbi:MAG: SsrA-binding protein SmpB [Alphaproteobacteria bacterium]|nr:MAG: SsrA-binding protein SmpB [Alphaproteobacteria bacterium]